MTQTMVVGSSEPVDWQLQDDGVDLVGTSWDVSIAWRDTVQSPAPDSEPTVAWLSAAAGTVRVTDTVDMAVGSYRFRFKLTAGAVVAFIPNLESDPYLWQVVKV